jgi:ABC-type multidrug transport system ATPase subunit
MPFLTLDGVSKRFDGIVAVDSVSCQVDRGQVVGFLGPNGPGKSTTMRMITQYYEPDAGAIRLAISGPPASIASTSRGARSPAWPAAR